MAYDHRDSSNSIDADALRGFLCDYFNSCECPIEQCKQAVDMMNSFASETRIGLSSLANYVDAIEREDEQKEKEKDEKGSTACGSTNTSSSALCK
jgi:hypothetical protein